VIDIKVLASGSGGNTYHLTDHTTPLLLEAGITWKMIKRGLNFRTSEIAGVLVSHSHGDHSKSVRDAMLAGLDVYVSAETSEELNITGHRVNIIKPKQQFKLGSWTILPFPLEHDVMNFGFLLQNTAGDKCVYITDTAYSPFKFSGITHLLIEANYSIDILRANVKAGIVAPELKNRIIKSHFSIENVLEFLKVNDLSKVQEIHLIHLSNDNSNAELFKRKVQQQTGKLTYVW